MNFRIAAAILKQELLTVRSIILILALTTLFVSFSAVIVNLPSFISFFFNDYLFFTKANVLWLIFIGSFSAISSIDIVLVTIMGVLFGINMTLLINKYNALKRRGNLRIMFGTGLISVFAVGCASCGLSFASLIGISAVIAILPFGGIELYILAILILLISLFYNLKQLIKVCKID